MNIVFDLPPAILIGLLVSTILPILTGLATTRLASPALKATVLAALAAVTGLLTELLAAVTAGVAYNIGTGLVLALVAFLVATAMHFGLWKPTTVADKAQGLVHTDSGDFYEPRHKVEPRLF